MSAQCDAKDKLATAVDSLTVANNAFRDVIRIRRNEIDRLERFESEFYQVKDKFTQFKTMAEDYDIQAEKLQIQLDDELNRHQNTAENLKIEIVKLKGMIENQRRENEGLEVRLKDNVDKLQKLKYQNDNNGTYANAFHIKSEQCMFVQRL